MQHSYYMKEYLKYLPATFGHLLKNRKNSYPNTKVAVFVHLNCKMKQEIQEKQA